MRVRLLIIAGFAALVSVPGPAGARTGLRPISLREELRAPFFVLPPRRPASFHMRWAHGPRLLTLSAAPQFTGGLAVVGVARPRDAAAVAAAYGVSPVFVNASLRALEVTGSAPALQALAAAVGLDTRVRYVESLRERRTLHRRNDPLTTSVDPMGGLPFEWQFSHVGVDRALNVDRGNPGVLVGVIDTGYGDVPDLTGKIARAWYFTDQATDARDTMGHGTFVSSLIASNNDDGQGMAGFCGSCKVAIVKDLYLNSFTISTAIHTLTDAGVRVINMSFGGPGISQIEVDALNYAISKGVLLVASSGNDGGAVVYPAAYLQPANGAPGLGLAVGASDASDRRPSWSNWGSNLSLVAPGTFTTTPQCNVGVLGALPPSASLFDFDCSTKITDRVTGARYAYSNGTSFSAPEVAGVAALVWAARPELANFQVASILLQSASRAPGAGWTPDQGWGVLNAANAVELATGRCDLCRRASALAGSATCSAKVGPRTLLPLTQQFTSGSVRCTWLVPGSAGGDTLEAHVEVTDAKTKAKGSRDFQADVSDVTAPRAQASPASGKYGARLTLRFRVTEETGVARRVVTVYRKGTKVFSSRGEFDDVASSPLRSLAWKAPGRGKPGPFKFCVQAWDRSGNESDPSCARIKLR
jgi:hypothetical protein